MTPSRREAPRRRMGRAQIVLAAGLMAGIGSSAARAEVVVSEDEFRDWIGRCETETTTGEVVCFIYTGRVAEVEGEELAARIVIGIGDQMDPIIYLDMPDVAEPANGFMLRVDTNEPFSGRFSSCSSGWCQTQAAGDIAVELVRQFRAGAEATASFILEDQELQVDLPLSLMGFTAAYERLLLIHSQAAEATVDAQAQAAEEQAAEEQAAEEQAADDEAADDESAGDEAADEDAGAEEPASDDAADAESSEEPAADDAAAPDDAGADEPLPDDDAAEAGDDTAEPAQ